MAEVSDLAEGLEKLTLQPTGSKTFVEYAIDRVNEAFGSSDWKENIDACKAYKWSVPSLGGKIGDYAEIATFSCLGSQKFCQLLGEPIYLLSGVKYLSS